MKNYKVALMLLLAIFAVVFILNAVLMYAIFGINVLNPRSSLGDRRITEQAGEDEWPALLSGLRSSAGSGPEIKDTEWTVNPDEAAELNEGLLQEGSAPGSGTAAAATNGGLTGSGIRADMHQTAAYYLTPDEVDFMGHISLEDKLAAMAILTRLGTQELDRIYNMALDGVTHEEYTTIKAALDKKLSASEEETLIRILDKNKILYADQGG